MANAPKSGGINSYLLYKKETTYGTGVTPDSKFGLTTNFNYKLNPNITGRYGNKGVSTSGRVIKQYVNGYKEFTGKVGDFDVQNANFLELVLGSKTGVGPYTYSVDDSILSFTLAYCIDNDTTDRNNTFTGCVVDKATIKAALNEPVTASIDLKIANATYDGTLETNTAVDTAKPYEFLNATIELPNGTEITNILESFDISISNNYMLHSGTQLTAQNATIGKFEASIKINTKYVDDALINKAYGGTDASSQVTTLSPTIEINLQNQDGDTMSILCTLSPITSYELNDVLGEAIKENVELKVANITVTETLA